MFTIYILKSLRNGKRYVGYTGKKPDIRLEEHNSGKNQFTKNNRPFTLIYTETYPDKESALRREKFLKSGQGRKLLDTIMGR